MAKKHKTETVCVCDTKATRGYSCFYDSPEGCDVPTKIMVASRYGIVTGLIMSTYDVLMYSHAEGLSKILSRYLYHTLPLAAMGATFAAVSQGLALARQKDDRWNYFIGGVACGPILGAYIGNKHAYFLGSLALGTIAVIKKTGVEENWTFFPEIHSHMGTIRSWRNDYTLVKDPKDIGFIHRCDKNKVLS